MTAAAKRALRKRALQTRDNLPPDGRERASHTLTRHLTAHPAWTRAHTIGTYVPIGSEMDTRPIIQHALREGKRVAVPRTDTRERHLTFHVIHTLDELREGAFRVPEPDPLRHEDVPPSALDLVTVPALALDPHGRRLGYGQGYYDRFLHAYDGLTIGLCYARLVLDTVPTEPHDVPLDVVLTENGVRGGRKPA